ncbi:MAG: sialidase family protein [Candidatus Thermoplasmatota archaeon]|jgi:hypothetical protein
MRTIAALAALLLLAGCLDSETPDPLSAGTSSSTTALPLVLETPVALPEVDLGSAAGEPNIAVGADGAIYVSDPSIGIWRSDDGGASYRKMAAKSITGGGDGDIVIDARGCIHWLGLFGTDAKGEAAPIPYQVSCDQGATFSDAVDLSNGTGSDREWIGQSQTGVLYASWRGSDAEGNGVISTTTSFDGGANWTPLAVMSPDAVGGPIVAGRVPGQVFEAMTTFPTGTLPTEGGSGIDLARSLDHGMTWEVLPVFVPPQSAQFGLIGFPTSIFPVVAMDDAQTLYVVFSADQEAVAGTTPKAAARFGVYLTSSNDLGQSWSDPVLLSNPDHVALMPWIDAGAAGRVVVTWYENTLGLPADVLPDLWNVKLWESITADEASPEGVTVQLNALPNHIGAVCTSGTGCLAGDRSLLDFFEVAIQPNGHPVATWGYSIAGTGVGVSAQGANVFAGGIASGTPLR